MNRADLGVSMQRAAAEAQVDVPPLDDAPADPAGPFPDSPGPAARTRPTLRARLFGRLADYARRYLTASVEHRLTHLQETQGALRHEVVNAAGQVLERIATLEQGHLQLHGHMQAELQRLRIETQRLQQQVDGLLGVLGPRLDELEIKARPLIAFDADSYAIRLADGYVMAPRDQPMFAVMVANATSGGLEPGVRRVLQALARPGGAAADVGANIGLHTLALARAVGPQGRVYAFEPEPGPRGQLQKMAALNGLRWVELHDSALGARAETMVFNISPVIGHSSLYALPEEDGEGRQIRVQVRPLDEVVEPGLSLDVVKIDVEGAELDVLAGMARVLSDNPDLAIVAEFGPSHLARVGVAPQAWFDAFAAHGLTPYLIEDPSGLCRPLSVAEAQAAESVNVAFVRPGGGAEARLPR